jgi:glycogenin glucosyltransferase
MKWSEDGGQFMIGITESRCVDSFPFKDIQNNVQQSVESTAERAPPIVQYHTKGEFQPVAPIVSSSQAPAPEETEREIFQPPIDEPLHETTETPKAVEQAYVPPVQTNVDKQPEVHYTSWDASKLVI